MADCCAALVAQNLILGFASGQLINRFIETADALHQGVADLPDPNTTDHAPDQQRICDSKKDL